MCYKLVILFYYINEDMLYVSYSPASYIYLFNSGINLKHKLVNFLRTISSFCDTYYYKIKFSPAIICGIKNYDIN